MEARLIVKDPQDPQLSLRTQHGAYAIHLTEEERAEIDSLLSAGRHNQQACRARAKQVKEAQTC